MGDKDKNLSVKKYPDVIKPYLCDIINNHKAQGRWKIYSGNTITEHKTQGEWKIHLTMAINLISFKPASDKKGTVDTKSDNVEIMISSERNF